MPMVRFGDVETRKLSSNVVGGQSSHAFLLSIINSACAVVCRFSLSRYPQDTNHTHGSSIQTTVAHIEKPSFNIFESLFKMHLRFRPFFNHVWAKQI